MKLFKLTLLILSVAMLLFSCTAGRNVNGLIISTHKYINYQSAETGHSNAGPNEDGKEISSQ
ncbi:hypothetical protein [Ferruginibacter sp. HRS2-29]|uniref:hypothetical protein n=1 Tax=Ferruginibacter sp. HRS2-29 TaxID=2487334 RepID=UPI0020CCBFAD|nr:hypothetical protein [Ferruginibacter sp. HRS2-29]